MCHHSILWKMRGKCRNIPHHTLMKPYNKTNWIYGNATFSCQCVNWKLSCIFEKGIFKKHCWGNDKDEKKQHTGAYHQNKNRINIFDSDPLFLWHFHLFVHIEKKHRHSRRRNCAVQSNHFLYQSIDLIHKTNSEYNQYSTFITWHSFWTAIRFYFLRY